MKVYENIRELIAYGRFCGLIEEADEIYVRNRLLSLMGLSDYEGESEEEKNREKEPWSEETKGDRLFCILSALCDDAAARGIINPDTVTQRDLFDTKLMNTMMPRPSEVIREFEKWEEQSPKAASDYFYKLSKDSDYIRRYRIKKDLHWTTKTPYGELDITVNLSKPEKDPKDIAAAKKMKQTGYPKCLLCIDNVGYAGRSDHPARDNHRIIPVKLDGADWGFQYSPYVYYNEHCIVFCMEHTPMRITDGTFRRLFDFVKRFPHYFLGSNADLPIVGGSILTHDHFQGGNYSFAMAKAGAEACYGAPEAVKKEAPEFEAEIVKWPMSVLRLRAKDTEILAKEAARILSAWRGYTDEAACIYAETEGEPHNTITPIVRFRDGAYEIDLVLRNNLVTKEHPLGLYHPHAKLHHIKKENIGLIEVMGLAVLPARLKTEMAELKDVILRGLSEGGLEKALSLVRENESLKKHADWTSEWLPLWLSKEGGVTEENLDGIMQEEIGQVFCAVLEDAGVYKCTKEGREAFDRFLKSVGYTRI